MKPIRAFAVRSGRSGRIPGRHSELGKNPQKIALKPGLGGLSEFDPIQSIISLFAANPNCDAGPICAERAGPCVSFLSLFRHSITRFCAGMHGMVTDGTTARRGLLRRAYRPETAAERPLALIFRRGELAGLRNRGCSRCRCSTTRWPIETGAIFASLTHQDRPRTGRVHYQETYWARKKRKADSRFLYSAYF